MTAVQRLVPVPGGEVWADVTAGDGPPLMLLHPGVGDSRIWEPMLPRLADGFRRDALRRTRIWPVRAGHRGLPTARRSGLRPDHLGLDRVGLVGCSMGGGTGNNLALAYPARVSGIVLVCPGISGHRWPAEPELDAEYERLMQAADHDGLVALAARESAAGYCYPPDRKQQTVMAAKVTQRLAEPIEEQDSVHPVDAVWHGGEPLTTPLSHMRSLLAPFEHLRRGDRMAQLTRELSIRITPGPR